MLGINDGDGSLFSPTDQELSVSCGCTTASPSPTTASAPTPNTAPSCGEGDSFSIVSDSLPEAEGCYLDTAFFQNDSPVYSTTGTTDLEQVFVFVVELETSTVSAMKCQRSKKEKQ